LSRCVVIMGNDVRFGSLAALLSHISSMPAFGRKADVNRAHFDANQWAPFLSLFSATVPKCHFFRLRFQCCKYAGEQAETKYVIICMHSYFYSFQYQ